MGLTDRQPLELVLLPSSICPIHPSIFFSLTVGGGYKLELVTYLDSLCVCMCVVNSSFVLLCCFVSLCEHTCCDRYCSDCLLAVSLYYCVNH